MSDIYLNFDQTNDPPLILTFSQDTDPININFSESESPISLNMSSLVVGKTGDDAHVTPLSLTLTVAGWSDNIQTVEATGVTSSNFLIVSPSPASQTHYIDCGVLCWSQSTDSLVFKCDTTPTEELYVNVGVFS